MSSSSAPQFKFTATASAQNLPITNSDLIASVIKTNEYLIDLPTRFGSTSSSFYTILNQRNLSGFVGEVFKHVIHSLCPSFIPNPHPDGRPDLLNLSIETVAEYFKNNCFDRINNAPLREMLAPFLYGGIEIKASIGNTPSASDFPVGVPRNNVITGLNYWAHHAHECDLLGIYYDYCKIVNGSPQIKGLVFSKITATDWNKVSTGDPSKKKTSNTSLNKQGTAKIKSSLVLLSTEPTYVKMFERLQFNA